MGLSRDSRHKRRVPANTKLGESRIRRVRTMGGNLKFRALRL